MIAAIQGNSPNEVSDVPVSEVILRPTCDNRVMNISNKVGRSTSLDLMRSGLVTPHPVSGDEHDSDCDDDPEQAEPPLLGAGLSHTRDLDLEPEPEQLLQPPQAPHPPSTALAEVVETGRG